MRFALREREREERLAVLAHRAQHTRRRRAFRIGQLLALLLKDPGAKPDPKIEDDYKEAMRMLRDISNGIVTLSIAGAEVPGTEGNGVRITDRERPLTEDNLKGFI